MMRPTLPLLLLLLSPGLVAAQVRLHDFPTKQEVADRRTAIDRELEGNQAAALHLLELLDSTPLTARPARTSIESQIRQLDDRNHVLFAQLDELDQQQQDRDQFAKLQAQVRQWEEEAGQLRLAGHIFPAALRTGKARLLQRMLQQGTWRHFAPQTPSVAAPATSKQAQPQQAVLREVRQLRAETQALQTELQQLRTAVEALTKRLPTAP